MRKIKVSIEGKKRIIDFIFMGNLISLKFMKKDVIKGLKSQLTKFYKDLAILSKNECKNL